MRLLQTRRAPVFRTYVLALPRRYSLRMCRVRLFRRRLSLLPDPRRRRRHIAPSRHLLLPRPVSFGSGQDQVHATRA